MLGLGDLVKEIERRQPRSGRLDLLLQDAETHKRYEVEIQLGKTDESHIIRTIEYWDIERKRYPQYDHVAVIVAEDITSRFLNVIGLFNGSIPLVAIQMRALEVGDQLTLTAMTVLDEVSRLGLTRRTTVVEATDRRIGKPSGFAESVGDVADGMQSIVINQVDRRTHAASTTSTTSAFG